MRRRLVARLLRAAGATAFLAACILVRLAYAEEQVAIHVRTVLATDSPNGVDTRLANYRRQLHQLFHYPSYRLVKEEDRSTPFGNPNNFEIPGGRYLEVLPMQLKEDRLHLRVLLIEGTSPPPLDTDFTVPNRGNIWVGGPRNPDGVLLISIGAEATP
jgi:hypothetical protein